MMLLDELQKGKIDLIYIQDQEDIVQVYFNDEYDSNSEKLDYQTFLRKISSIYFDERFELKEIISETNFIQIIKYQNLLIYFIKSIDNRTEKSYSNEELEAFIEKYYVKQDIESLRREICDFLFE